MEIPVQLRTLKEGYELQEVESVLPWIHVATAVKDLLVHLNQKPGIAKAKLELACRYANGQDKLCALETALTEAQLSDFGYILGRYCNELGIIGFGQYIRILSANGKPIVKVSIDRDRTYTYSFIKGEESLKDMLSKSRK